jgi:dihydroflavonol-4-reductase
VRVPIPATVAQFTAAIMEFFADRVTHQLPAATVEAVRIALRSKALSIEKSRRELGYAPRPIEPALREAIAAIPGGTR